MRISTSGYSLADWRRFINTDTLVSLQIAQPESHPNAFNQGPGKTSSGAKESLSLYGIFHHMARTPQGKARLRGYFLRPILDLKTIHERHDFISVFLRPDNAIPMQKIPKCLARVKNLRTVIIHLHKGISAGNPKFGGFKSNVWSTLLAVGSASQRTHFLSLTGAMCSSPTILLTFRKRFVR